MGIHYLGENYDLSVVEDYLRRYTENVYTKEFANIEKRDVQAIADKIRDTYEKEKTPDAVEIIYDGKTLTVNMKYCPAVKHLKATGRVVSPWYRYTTETVMQVLAEKAGLTFNMEAYDEETGAARYTFA